MSEITDATVGCNAFYRRCLQGADFSLEANTRKTPRGGRFYVLRKGRVVFQSPSFAEAQQVYFKLCREYWETHLTSEDPEERLACARGLLSLDLRHEEAAAVLRDDGEPADLRDLKSARMRRWAKDRAASRKARSRTPTTD